VSQDTSIDDHEAEAALWVPETAHTARDLPVRPRQGACQEVCVSPSGEMVDWVVARPPLVIVFHRLSGVNVVRPRCAAGAPR
jgi:hypothetical protein